MPACEWGEDECPNVINGVCRSGCFKHPIPSIGLQEILDAFPLVRQQQAQRQDVSQTGPSVAVRYVTTPLISPDNGEDFEGEEDPWAADRGS